MSFNDCELEAIDLKSYQQLEKLTYEECLLSSV